MRRTTHLIRNNERDGIYSSKYVDAVYTIACTRTTRIIFSIFMCVPFWAVRLFLIAMKTVSGLAKMCMWLERLNLWQCIVCCSHSDWMVKFLGKFSPIEHTSEFLLNIFLLKFLTFTHSLVLVKWEYYKLICWTQTILSMFAGYHARGEKTANGMDYFALCDGTSITN